MLKEWLVPEQAVEKGGEGNAVSLGGANGRMFVVTLNITRVVEQEALDVALMGSEDGAAWTSKLIAFPQKFYTGTHQLLLDLSDQPAIKHVRAKWDVNRWGRGDLTAHFTFSVSLEESPA